MDNFIILAILLLLVFYNVLHLATANIIPKVSPKTHNKTFNLKVTKELSKEIKNMKLPDVAFYHQNKMINYSLSAMKIEEPIDMEDVKQIKFKLFTRKSTVAPKCYLDDLPSLDNCAFDFLKDVKIVIHGWVLNAPYEGCIPIKNTYLMNRDINVILVDWTDISGNFSYPYIVAQTKSVGWHIGNFLNRLIHFGSDPKNMHIIGHGLGAHIAGFAAEVMIGKVGRITALDPALPGFSANTLSQFGGAGRLAVDHADFIDVIHTNGGTFGLSEPIGHVDFYPHGGKVQPGCWLINFMCSNYRAYELFEESISYCMFPSKPCEAADGTEEILMGAPVPHTARGRYCLNTNNHSPYGLLDMQNSRRIFGGDTLKSKLRKNKPDVAESSGCIVTSVYACELIIGVNILL